MSIFDRQSSEIFLIFPIWGDSASLETAIDYVNRRGLVQYVFQFQPRQNGSTSIILKIPRSKYKAVMKSLLTITEEGLKTPRS